MREDIVSKFRDTLGERFAANTNHLYTWYQCGNGHIYAINNCGEPQQNGKCFCGSQIGGVKKLVAGNRKLENYTFSEKGYNLAPICLSSAVDSERKLSGLALALLRWMIHAALLSSPCITQCREMFGGLETEVSEYLCHRLVLDFKGIKECLEVNVEESRIWLCSALHNVFSFDSGSTNSPDLTIRAERDELESTYLAMVQPLISDPRDVISRGVELVYPVENQFTRYLLGLDSPPDGESLVEVAEFLQFRSTAHSHLKLPDSDRYPTTARYMKHVNYIRVLGCVGKLIRMFVDLLHKYNNKITEYTASRIKLNSDSISRWNSCWDSVKEMPQLLNTAYLTPHLLDLPNLDTRSTLLDILPRPSSRTWYMIHNLAALHNIFSHPQASATSILDICSVGEIREIDLIGAVNDAWDTCQFDWDKLEAALSLVLAVDYRIPIDIRTLDVLLFHPLKYKNSWYISLDKLRADKLHADKLRIDHLCTDHQGCVDSQGQDYTLPTTPTVEYLKSLEILMQVNTSPRNILALCDIATLYNVPDIPACQLFEAWHETWFQISSNQRNFSIPSDLEILPQVEVDNIPELERMLGMLQVLHMMIVEWVIHWPGFDPAGLSLSEALDFYCEKVGWGTDVAGIVPEHLKLEHSIGVWNKLVYLF